MALSSCNNELCPGRDMDVSIAVPVRFSALQEPETQNDLIIFFPGIVCRVVLGGEFNVRLLRAEQCMFF